jgi:hypothetical protein
MNQMNTRRFGLIGAAAGLLMASGAALAQSANSQGFDKPLSTRSKAPQAEVQAKQRASEQKATDKKSHNNISITRSDDEGVCTVTINGEDINATINGEEVSKDRIQREGQTLRLLDEDGKTFAEFQVGLAGEGIQLHSGHGMAGLHGNRAAEPGQSAWLGSVAVAGEEPPPVMLGITMGEPSETLLEYLGLDKGSAVLIDHVYEGLPASESGMEDADILIEFDGVKPLDEVKVREILRSKQPGDKVVAKVFRKGETKELKIKLRAYDAEKLGGQAKVQGEPFFTPEDEQAFAWSPDGDARKALEEALRSLEKSHGMDADAVRDHAHKAIEQALKRLHDGSGSYRYYRSLPSPGGAFIVGPKPGQVFNVPQPPAPSAPMGGGRGGDLSRQMEELRAQLNEVQRSRDELKAQLDEIKGMLKEIARERR